MAKEKFYVNPALQAQTKIMLVEYKKRHVGSRTPMADAYSATPNVTEDDKVRFVRAARSLGWQIVKHKGNYYENGIQIWQ